MDIIDILVYFVVFFNICIFIWIADLLIISPFIYICYGPNNFGIIGETEYATMTFVSNTFPSYTLSHHSYV